MNIVDNQNYWCPPEIGGATIGETALEGSSTILNFSIVEAM